MLELDCIQFWQVLFLMALETPNMMDVIFRLCNLKMKFSYVQPGNDLAKDRFHT